MSCPPFDRITCGEVLRTKLEVFLELVGHNDSVLISCSEVHLQRTPPRWKSVTKQHVDSYYMVMAHVSK